MLSFRFDDEAKEAIVAVFKDYAPGQLFVVTRKNHHKHGQSGSVEKVLVETGSVYGHMADGEMYYFAFNSIAPYPAPVASEPVSKLALSYTEDGVEFDE